MPEFVKEIRKTCGDVHELQEVQGPCKDMLDQKSEEFGCCWESVMQVELARTRVCFCYREALHHRHQVDGLTWPPRAGLRDSRPSGRP